MIAFGLPLFAALGATDFVGDEPIYAFAVDRMLDQGDWLTPKSIPNDQAPFLEKPPLKLWLIAASVRAGVVSQNEFGYRFLDVIFGIAAFLYMYGIGLELSGIVCGLTAVLVLFGHQPLLLEHGLRSNNMEAGLVLAYCGGIFHAMRWFDARTRRRRLGHGLCIGLWFVFGFMMKFVAAAFLPICIVAMGTVSRRWRERLLADWREWSVVTVFAAALILPWFLYQTRLRGREFWEIIFGQHILVRFTAYLDPSHVQPWSFYVTTMVHEFLTERILILVSAGLLLLAYRALWQRRDHELLVLMWFVLPVAAISAGTSKLYHYAYPFLPPLALAAGLVPMAAIDAARKYRPQMVRALEHVWPQSMSGRVPRWLRAPLIAVAVIAIALAVLAPIVGPISVRIGHLTIFRTATIARPLFVGTILLIGLGLFKMAPMAFVIVLVTAFLPFDGYRNARAAEIARAKDDGAQLHVLRNCLLRVQAEGAAKGVLVYTKDLGQWKYVYYLRQAGWRMDEASDATISERLLDPAARRPIVLTSAAWNDMRASSLSDPKRRQSLRQLDAMPRLAWDDGRMILLPGPYGVCGAVKSRLVRDTRHE